MARTIGIFGGSFDPPHAAHVLAASYALACAPIDALLVIPTYDHPFDKPLAPYAHRVRMCALAMTDLARCEVSRVEEELGGKSFTWRTLEALHQRYPGDAFRLIVGADIVRDAPKWDQFPRVEALAPLWVIGREGQGATSGSPLALPAISSTEIRRKLGENAEIEGLVPRRVIAYIEAHGLYREGKR